MRHQKFSQRLSRPLGHRRATVRNLAISLLRYQRIKTTKAKAKFVQPLVDHLIKLAKYDNLQSRRNAFRLLHDRDAVVKLFNTIAPLFKQKTSGFTRTIRYAHRQGDGAELVFLELTEKISKEKPAQTKKEKVVQEKTIPSPRPEKPKPEKPKAEIKPEEPQKLPPEKARPPKKIKPKKFLGGLRKLFKKERDSL
jgi:large subunit ribosomal protein L17